MVSTARFGENPFFPTTQRFRRTPPPRPLIFRVSFNCSSHHQNPKLSALPPSPCPDTTNHPLHLLKPIILTPNQASFKVNKVYKKKNGLKTDFSKVGSRQMLILCGFGYWLQGFRCFPWLGLNFNMANALHLNPSTLQLVQNTANLPMVAKPLYGVLSDALYIGGAHRIPYISIGALLQVLSWGLLAVIPVAGNALPTLMVCMLLSNLGASITEVTQDALIAEYGQEQKVRGLQSYAFMALAAGGILGNLFGGYFLLKTQQPKFMFLLFALLLSIQFAISLGTREDSLGLQGPSEQFSSKSISQILHKQSSALITAVSHENISRPLSWIVASIVVVPVLSGTLFCYQTQCLNLDSSIIGMSKVVGQLMLLLTTVLYDRYWKGVPVRKLIFRVQIVYAVSLLFDLILVKQINLRFGIPNEIYVLCLSGLAETVAQFKLLPFSVLFVNLCPRGCEGSLMSFLASALILSSIISGFSGVGLASVLGISSGDYSKLPVGIIIQFLAALIPLGFISFVPMSESVEETKMRKEKRMKRSRASRRDR